MQEVTFAEASLRPSNFRTYLSWTVISLCVAAIVGFTILAGHHDESAAETTNAIADMQGKYMVGAASVAPDSKDQMKRNIRTDVGSVYQRLSNIVLLAELADTKTARERLDTLSQVMDDEDELAESEGRDSYATESGRSLHSILSKLYADGTTHEDAVSELAEADREQLIESLGWHGELALAPKGGDKTVRRPLIASARTLCIGMICGFMVAMGVGLFGFVGLVSLVMSLAKGSVRLQLEPGRGKHALYLETFAIWLVTMMVGQVAAGAAASFLPAQFRLLPILFVFFATLLVLYWPKMNGISFTNIRQDIGWCLPRPGWATPLYGGVGYVMGLPLLAFGVVGTLILTMLASLWATANPLAPTSSPSHPIMAELSAGNPFVVLQVFLLGSVAAPFVEETMFRGVLYRYLRDSTWNRRALSIVFSTLLNCFIFAAIHPQGVVTIPALMSLAAAFTFAREVLNSLVPSMLMHAISNGIALSVSLLLFG